MPSIVISGIAYYRTGFPYSAFSEGWDSNGDIQDENELALIQNDDGSWTRPKNMGPSIITGAKEVYPFVSFDGKYLFFMSNRVSELNRTRIPDGPGNVYWVDVRILERYR